MRCVAAYAFAVSVSLITAALAQDQAAPVEVAQVRKAVPPSPALIAPSAFAAPAAPAASVSCPGNPNALGVARVVEIDTSGGPGFGFEHFKAHDFLRHKEVLLTFDDGPWPRNTPAILDALAAHCAKATFFPIGKHAANHPEILRQVAAAGHTIGSHTWSHQNLERASVQEAMDDIEKGVSAVRLAVGGSTAPFFRFPALRHPPELVKYLGERNIGIFSTDMDSFDFKMRKPDQVVASVMAKLKKFGKGIVLMHDLQPQTADALPDLLKQLKIDGYRIVHMKAKDPVTTIAKYDEQVRSEQKLLTLSDRPTSSVVRTITGD
jgi:peptidoglycan/xylan/chitin deacetylase (PgdA/CDA1 family)